ncbi:MAG: AbrB/MazE/SpoVT family DNA-binding domain-containing protein [Candidatus Kaiserbacteria bacterium]|nr:AbrB/MazE/SpoVT family DNA-binding domain-containing protein [Candidatus Kaiserbacteria bacterium]
METNIQKWGNSLGVRLPKSIADNQSLKAGSRVKVTETKTGISIEVVKKKHRTLDEMLKNFDKSTQHELVDWGPDVGNEILEKW